MASFSCDVDCYSPRPKSKLFGSATYNCKYDPLSKKNYPCIEEVKNDSHAFYCTCCMKKLSCKPQWVLVMLKGTFKELVSHEKVSKRRCNLTPQKDYVKEELSMLKLR